MTDQAARAFTDRFEPVPGKPYGICSDGSCDTVLETEADSRRHLSETFDGTSSHSIRVTNPPRQRRVNAGVDTIVDDAITAAVDELLKLVAHNHATPEEVRTALSYYNDFSDAWGGALAENAL